MSRLRRYLPPLVLLLLPISIAGKLLLTPIIIDGSAKFGYRYEMGWPRPFLNFGESYHPHTAGYESNDFSAWSLAADLAILSTALLLVAALVLRCWRQKHNWRQFSIRGLLGLTMVVGILLGWWVSHRNAWNREQQILERVRYLLPYQEDFTPKWLPRLSPEIDTKIFFRAKSLTLDGRVTENGLKRLSFVLQQLPKVNQLTFQTGWRPIDSTLTYPSDLLDADNSLDLSDKPPPLDRVRVMLRQQRPEESRIVLSAWRLSLRKLRFETCILSDEILALVCDCPKLEELTINSGTGFTDAGIAQLTRLPRLRSLAIQDSKISDETRNLLKNHSFDNLVLDPIPDQLNTPSE